MLVRYKLVTNLCILASSIFFLLIENDDMSVCKFQLAEKLYVLASLIFLINFDNESYPYMDSLTLGRRWKSLTACQITHCLHALGMVGTFTWNSRL
jgi:hypothetical protein